MRPMLSISFVVALFGAALALPAHTQEIELDGSLQSGMASTARAELQEQVNSEPPKTDDKQELCVFYHKRGVANYSLGNYPRAVDDLRLSLLNNQPARLTPLQWGDRWYIQGDLSLALTASGEWLANIDHWNGAIREYQQNSLDQYHIAQLALAKSEAVLGNFSEATAALKGANATLSKLRSGQNWSLWGDYHLYYNSATNAYFFEQQGNSAEAFRLRTLALDYAEKEVDKFNHLYPPGHQMIRYASTHLADAKTSLASVLATQRKFGEAEFYGRSALEEQFKRHSFNTASISWSLGVLGWNRFQRGDLAGAQTYYSYALTATERSGAAPYSIALAGSRSQLASVFLAQGRWSDAIRLYEERDRGLRSNAQQWKRYGSGSVSWALALQKTGQSQQAKDMVEGQIAYKLKQPIQNQFAIAQLRGVLGMAEASLNNTAAALQAFEQAIPELIRHDPDDATSENSGYWRVFWRRAILEAYLDLLAKQYVAEGEARDPNVADKAFRIADLARGSSVQEAISAVVARAQLPDRDLAALARKDQDAINRIAALSVVLGRLAAAPENDTFRKLIAGRLDDIERIRNDHVALQAEIRKRFPEYAELIDPRPPGLADVGKALAPNEALVAIYVGEAQTFVWTIRSAANTAFRVVPLGRDAIEEDIAKLRSATDLREGSLAQLPAFDLERAGRLYQALFAPDEGLWKDADVLNIVPHAALAQLPFGVLVTAAPTGQPAAGAQAAYKNVAWLVRKVAPVQLPSTTAFAALRRAPMAKSDRQAFIGFGDPLFAADTSTATYRSAVRNLYRRKTADRIDELLDAAARGARAPMAAPAKAAAVSLADAFSLLPSLPDTADELNEIADSLKTDRIRSVYLGRAANETDVKQPGRLENYRVVAFATHGIAPGELTGLDQPALVLSNPALTGEKDQDGFLTMEEVLGLKLDADWVVLSACNTASGEGQGEEALSGLGRAFFFAGARSLLLSNWAVESTSARLLTTELFKRQAENPALSRAEALQQSMLALMVKNAEDANGRATFSYAHPLFWAPFSLVGDSGLHAAVK